MADAKDPKKDKPASTGNNAVLEIFVFFIILAAASAYWKNITISKKIDATSQQTQTTNTSPVPVVVTETHVKASSQVAVTFTTKGFNPISVTVSKGDTVVFNNKSNNSFWPISNDTNQSNLPSLLYPGFDARQPILPGQAYSFTFDKVGTWGYHNQLKQTQTGTVIVK